MASDNKQWNKETFDTNISILNILLNINSFLKNIYLFIFGYVGSSLLHAGFL